MFVGFASKKNLMTTYAPTLHCCHWMTDVWWPALNSWANYRLKSGFKQQVFQAAMHNHSALMSGVLPWAHKPEHCNCCTSSNVIYWVPWESRVIKWPEGFQWPKTANCAMFFFNRGPSNLTVHSTSPATTMTWQLTAQSIISVTSRNGGQTRAGERLYMNVS